MQTPINNHRLSALIGRAAAVTFLTAAGTLGLHAQQSAGTAASLPAINLKSALIAPLDLSAPADLNYSSSTGSAELANAENFSLSSSEDQPPPRRRYGRPNYNDSRTNPDGSAKYTFEAGAGFTLATGGTHNYLAPSYNFQIGVGRNFNKRFGVIAQFDWDNFGSQTATLNNQLAIYNGPYFLYDIPQLGGSSHLWSFTLNPIYNYYSGDNWGGYVIAGLGFYHKTANFTTPVVIQEDTFFGPIAFQANQSIDKYTSNAFGVNAGFGFTYKLSRWAGERLYAEARYVFVDNQPRPFDYGDVNFNNVNVFPQNSARTTYIPVTFGIRF